MVITSLMMISCSKCRREIVGGRGNSRTQTSSRLVLFCSLHAVTSYVIYYSTHTPKNVIYLLNSTGDNSGNINMMMAVAEGEIGAG